MQILMWALLGLVALYFIVRFSFALIMRKERAE
jgi:hypothetical protein